jgi:hypothetical protein
MDADTYGGAYLSAVVVSENVRPPDVDCNGDIVKADGTSLLEVPEGGGIPEPVSFRPGGRSPLVGCLTVMFP